MKTMKNFGLSVLLMILMAGAVHGAQADEMTARKAVVSAGAGTLKTECALKETASININFNNLKVDVDKIKEAMDKKIEEAKAIGREVGLESVEVQNFSYNTYNNGGSECEGGGGDYRSNGSVSFVVMPAGKAPAFTKALIGKGFSAGLNVSGYSQCGEYGN